MVADLQHGDDIRVVAKPAHSALLTKKTLPILIQLAGENLHRHRRVQRGLGTPITNAETTAPDLLGVVEPGGTQLSGDGITNVALRLEWVSHYHRFLGVGSA
ncbi:MAG: hypothetical protein WCE76_23770 [Mycobacterium sp.]